MTKKQIVLRDIFAAAVDGGNSNAFAIIMGRFERMPIEAKRLEITFNDIYEAMKPLSREWDKEIEEAIGC